MNLQEWTEFEIVAEGEEDDDEDELEDDEDDDDDDDDEDDGDDDVGTNERGKEMLKAPGERDATDQETAEPDVSADRKTPRDDAKARKPPLAIEEIEDLEDDAPGG